MQLSGNDFLPKFVNNNKSRRFLAAAEALLKCYE
jgi:hypothetical protein